MLQNLRKRVGARLDGDSEAGFTLVELLVVMLILGILAAIAIPSFFNQKNKANDADAKADAKTAQTAMETYATDNNGQYTGGTVAGLQGIETTLNGAALAVGNIASNTYTVTVTSTTGNTFSINRLANGTQTLTCTVPAGNDRGGCPVGGTW